MGERRTPSPPRGPDLTPETDESVPCPKCKTTGDVACPSCHGQKLEPCPECHGRGRVELKRWTKNTAKKSWTDPAEIESRYEAQCIRCSAIGHLGEPCRWCLGRGSVGCDLCSGSGKVTKAVADQYNAAENFWACGCIVAVVVLVLGCIIGALTKD